MKRTGAKPKKASGGRLFSPRACSHAPSGVAVTLSPDRKTITVSGTPTADVEVTIPDAAQEGIAISQNTGDNSHIGLWIAIMILSLCGLEATLFIGKKKRVYGR